MQIVEGVYDCLSLILLDFFSFFILEYHQDYKPDHENYNNRGDSAWGSNNSRGKGGGERGGSGSGAGGPGNWWNDGGNEEEGPSREFFPI